MTIWYFKPGSERARQRKPIILEGKMMYVVGGLIFDDGKELKLAVDTKDINRIILDILRHLQDYPKDKMVKIGG